jgi:xanthine phosphoribosyltransferase
MSNKSMEEVMTRINAMHFAEDFDVIVAIANGGIIPAALLSQRLQKKVELLRINLRDTQHRPLYPSPQLLEKPAFAISRQTILLVEDRVKTGATINFAKEMLKEAKLIKTFAVNGHADYALYNEACFKFPWIMPAATTTVN